MTEIFYPCAEGTSWSWDPAPIRSIRVEEAGQSIRFTRYRLSKGMKKMGRRYKVNSDEINLCRDLSCGEYYADPHNRDMGLLKEYDLAVRKAML